MTKKKNRNKGAKGKGEEQKEKVEKAENKSEPPKETEDNNNNEVHHDTQHNKKCVNEDSRQENIQEVDKKVKKCESKRKDNTCKEAKNGIPEVNSESAERQDCDEADGKDNEQKQEREAEEGARKEESLPSAVSNTDCVPSEAPDGPAASKVPCAPSSCEEVPCAPSSCGEVPCAPSSCGEGSPVGLACSLCSAPCLGPCRKCREPLCPSCLPLHIFRARCLPWKVEKGRLVATREIKPLEVVVVDRAIVTIPTGKVCCLGCGREVSCTYLCPSCRLPLCGTACPRAHSHRPECSVLAGVEVPVVEEEAEDQAIFPTVGVIRILTMKKERPNDWARICCLPWSPDPSTSPQLAQVQGLLSGLGYTEDEVEQAFHLARSYGYNLPDLPDGMVRSVFPLQTRLGHSCLPSLQYIEREGGRHIVLQAVKPISRGEPLTVRYTPFLQGRIGLTRWLRKQRGVYCSCARCADGTELGTFTSSALCPEEGCREEGGLLLPVDPTALGTDWICSSCQKLTKSREIEELEESFVSRFCKMPKGDLNCYYRFLNELGERFHASHHLVMRMAQFLVILQGKCLESLPLERIQTQSLLCEKLIAYASRLDPGATQNRAKLLLEKNKADLNLAKLECEAGRISRKVFMQKIKEGVKVEMNAKKILYFNWETENKESTGFM